MGNSHNAPKTGAEAEVHLTSHPVLAKGTMITGVTAVRGTTKGTRGKIVIKRMKTRGAGTTDTHTRQEMTMEEAPTRELTKMKLAGTTMETGEMSTGQMDIPAEEADMGIPAREADKGTPTIEAGMLSEINSSFFSPSALWDMMAREWGSQLSLILNLVLYNCQIASAF